MYVSQIDSQIYIYIWMTPSPIHPNRRWWMRAHVTVVSEMPSGISGVEAAPSDGYRLFKSLGIVHGITYVIWLYIYIYR